MKSEVLGSNSLNGIEQKIFKSIDGHDISAKELIKIDLDNLERYLL